MEEIIKGSVYGVNGRRDSHVFGQSSVLRRLLVIHASRSRVMDPRKALLNSRALAFLAVAVCAGDRGWSACEPSSRYLYSLAPIAGCGGTASGLCPSDTLW
jgi:hypothetical protein